MPIEFLVIFTVGYFISALFIGVLMFSENKLSIRIWLLWLFTPVIICFVISYCVLSSETIVAYSHYAPVQTSEIGDMTIYHFSYIDYYNGKQYRSIHLSGKPKTNTVKFEHWYKSWLIFYYRDTRYEFVEDAR